MCFSPLASFGLGSLLLPMGAYCAVSAYQKDRRYLLLAFVPILFGLQQITEGFVWLQLQADNMMGAYLFAYVYLFFAFAVWPACIPFSVYQLEDDHLVQKILKVFLIAGPLLSVILYLPVIIGWAPVTVAIVDHSIFYDVYQNKALLWIYTISYGMIIIIPLLLSSRLKIKIYGLMVLISLLISYWWYFYQFTSVWCFFAAGLSIYMGYIMYRVKKA